MKNYLYRLFQWLVKGIPVTKVNVKLYNSEPNAILKGRKILITGGNKGIGYQISKRFIEQGAEIVIVGRDSNSLEEVSKELSCSYIQYDLTDICNFGNLIEQAVEKLGGLDGLVNNAGICNIDNGFVNVTQESYDEQFLLNVKSPFFLTQSFIKYIQEKKINSSSILFITSERALYPDDAPYGMTKAAIGNIITGIARRFAIYGVQCNGIAPGVTANIINKPELLDDAYLKGAVGKRYIMPTEISEVALFLMSENSKCVSGEIFPCNQSNHYK
jgi:NAD(P)-dependent dehydrogenase (short-subunit alcohol dehydrogenase family)